VIISPEVQQKMGQYPAIAKIRDELSQGKDLSPWLSDSVRKKGSDPKADLMFNDWQILHFHLGSLFVQPDKIDRTGDLLFAYIAPDHAVFLDIQPHGSWSMRDLLRILLRVSPGDMTRCEFKGALGLSGGGRTDDEILKLRQIGVNTPIDIDGRIFLAPGLGVASSKHATRIVRAVQNLARQIVHMRKILEENAVPHRLLQQISKNIGVPVRLGVKMNAGHFILYDKNRNLDLMTVPVH
jgi:hypothetical protein